MTNSKQDLQDGHKVKNNVKKNENENSFSFFLLNIFIFFR
jgi:hypothetical protein